MKDEFVFGAESPEEAEAREIRERASKPGATFLSTYGQVIFKNARGDLSRNAHAFGLTSRERSAAFPAIILREMARRAREPLAKTLKGAPTPDVCARELEKAKGFRRAFESASGIRMFHPVRRPSLTDAARQEALEQYGNPELTAHERIARAQRAPVEMRLQAKELFDGGVCSYEESVMKLASRCETAERDRAARTEGRVKVRQRGRERSMER